MKNVYLRILLAFRSWQLKRTLRELARLTLQVRQLEQPSREQEIVREVKLVIAELNPPEPVKIVPNFTREERVAIIRNLT